MSQNSNHVDFENLIRVALPLIKNRSEPNFDELLSKWMGKSINEEFGIWKDSSVGKESPREDQIRCLLTIWRKHAGEIANVRGFIELLQKVQGVSCTFRVGLEKSQKTGKTSDEFGIEIAESFSYNAEQDKCATKIQSAYRGYRVRKNYNKNKIRDTENSSVGNSEQTDNLLDTSHIMTSSSHYLNMNPYAITIQRSYRKYRARQACKQHETENEDGVIDETKSQMSFNSAQNANLKTETPTSETSLRESAIIIQSAYRGYIARKMCKKMKKANIIFMYPECMTNVLRENTKTIERFYQGYQTRKKYQKWKKAALTIQSFYRLRKNNNILCHEMRRNGSDVNHSDGEKQKRSRYLHTGYLLSYSLSFFLTSFIMSCLLISLGHINKTHYHIF